MKIIVLLLTTFFCFKSKCQTIPIKNLVSVYKKDSAGLERYLNSIKYPYIKAYGEKRMRILGATQKLERVFTESDTIFEGYYPMLSYIFKNAKQLNECRQFILVNGFVLDSLQTKLQSRSWDTVECYFSYRENIEIRLSDNNFKYSMKQLGNSYPMSAYSGQNIHMYSILVRRIDYNKYGSVYK